MDNHPAVRPSREVADREFQGHARVYVIVNLLLVAIWAVTGAGYFWPIWPILGWGIGVVCHAVGTYVNPGRDADELEEPPATG